MENKLHPSAAECPVCHEIYSKFIGHKCEVLNGKDIQAQKKQQVRKGKEGLIGCLHEKITYQ